MVRQILVVDNEAASRQLLEKFFCKDYEVFRTADSFEALEVVKAQNISFVISDHRIPVNYLKKN